MTELPTELSDASKVAASMHKSGNTNTAVTVQADANRLQTESGAVGQPEAARVGPPGGFFFGGRTPLLPGRRSCVCIA